MDLEDITIKGAVRINTPVYYTYDDNKDNTIKRYYVLHAVGDKEYIQIFYDTHWRGMRYCINERNEESYQKLCTMREFSKEK